MYPWMDINIPGSLANNTLIAGVVIVITAPLLITIYVYCRRTRAKHLREEEVGRMWINEAQYEEPEIRMYPTRTKDLDHHQLTCNRGAFSSTHPGESLLAGPFPETRRIHRVQPLCQCQTSTLPEPDIRELEKVQ